jgi:transposase
VNEIAQQLGVGWHTIDRHVRAVRQRLEQLGLRPAPLRRKQEPICT